MMTLEELHTQRIELEGERDAYLAYFKEGVSIDHEIIMIARALTSCIEELYNILDRIDVHENKIPTGIN